MNKNFVLVDRGSNLQKDATTIVKFTMDGNDYLVYSVNESEENDQIFASRMIINSEGKCFLDDLKPEEKAKLSNVVYNIVILMPTDNQKGVSYDELVASLTNKFLVSLSSDIPELGTQDYYGNSSIAVTSKLLVEAALKFYGENLNKKAQDVIPEVPTWTVPVMENPVASVNVESAPVAPVSIGAENPSVVADTVQSAPSVPLPEVNNGPVLTTENNTNQSAVSNLPNPQIAIMSDPSLEKAGLNVQPNANNMPKAGFANSKYVIIGTICLVLAIVVVVVAYVLIKNL